MHVMYILDALNSSNVTTDFIKIEGAGHGLHQDQVGFASNPGAAYAYNGANHHTDQGIEYIHACKVD
ncbi:hypothetical protein D3C78_1397030 [compost metagenome]